MKRTQTCHVIIVGRARITELLTWGENRAREYAAASSRIRCGVDIGRFVGVVKFLLLLLCIHLQGRIETILADI